MGADVYLTELASVEVERNHPLYSELPANRALICNVLHNQRVARRAIVVLNGHKRE